jgi:hypothetical protein
MDVSVGGGGDFQESPAHQRSNETATAAHIADEVATRFLDPYNPTVWAMRERHPWLLLPAFTFPLWIAPPAPTLA